jgi:hypothetical protein
MLSFAGAAVAKKQGVVREFGFFWGVGQLCVTINEHSPAGTRNCQ